MCRNQNRAACVGLAGVLLLGVVGVTSARASAFDRHHPRGQSQTRIVSAPADGRSSRPPLRFEENRGQFDSEARFAARCGSFDALLTSAEAILIPSCDRSAAIRLRFRASASLTGEDRLGGVSNYLCGSDPKAWRTNVPSYSRVRYGNVAPGVDVVFHGGESGLEYDLLIAAGADPDAAAVEIVGALRVDLDESGALVAHTSSGECDRRPHGSTRRRRADDRRSQVDTSSLGRAASAFALASTTERSRSSSIRISRTRPDSAVAGTTPRPRWPSTQAVPSGWPDGRSPQIFLSMVRSTARSTECQPRSSRS